MTTVMNYPRYEIASAVLATTPVLDVGPPEDVLKRAGCTLRGKNQQKFLQEAAGKLAIRLGYSVVAVTAEDTTRTLGELSKHWLGR